MAAHRPLLHFDRMTDHVFDNDRLRRFLYRQGDNVFAIPEDSDLVRNLRQFFKTVGHIDNPNTLGFERPDDFKHLFNIVVRKGGGRLVHNQDTGIVFQRFGDFHDLALRH